VTAAVFIVRIEPTADASLAAIRERSKFGIAIAAMIKIIATTISNSISEKPDSLALVMSLSSKMKVPSYGTRPGRYWIVGRRLQVAALGATAPVVSKWITPGSLVQ